MYFYVLKDGHMIGRTTTKESAVSMIRSYQDLESKQACAYLLRSEFSIICGEAEEFISYTH